MKPLSVRRARKMGVGVVGPVRREIVRRQREKERNVVRVELWCVLC